MYVNIVLDVFSVLKPHLGGNVTVLSQKGSKTSCPISERKGDVFIRLAVQRGVVQFGAQRPSPVAQWPVRMSQDVREKLGDLSSTTTC